LTLKLQDQEHKLIPNGGKAKATCYMPCHLIQTETTNSITGKHISNVG